MYKMNINNPRNICIKQQKLTENFFMKQTEKMHEKTKINKRTYEILNMDK